MAGSAIHRQIQPDMIGVGGLIVIGQVAPFTGIGCVVVIPVVTSGTVIGDWNMCSIQYPEIIVLGELRRTPSGIGGMTHLTIDREVEGDVIGVGGLVEVVLMTGVTIGGRALVAGSMTGSAVHGDMGTGQRKVGQAVIKGIIGITCGMAGITGIAVVGISRNALVVLVGFRIQMAAQTAELHVVAGIDMTIHAFIPLSFMLSTIDGEVLPVMIKVGG